MESPYLKAGFKGERELEAERIVHELSIKFGSFGKTPELPEHERILIEDAKKRGINYGFYWKDRKIEESDEMRDLWKVSEPFDKDYERLNTCFKHIGSVGDRWGDPNYLILIDTRRACSVFDKRWNELRELANPWFKYVEPRRNILGHIHSTVNIAVQADGSINSEVVR